MKIDYFKKYLVIVPIIFLFSFIFISISYAQGPPTPARDYEVLVPLPGIGDGNSEGRSNLNTYLPAAFNLTVGIAVALAFIFITIGGVTYATSDALGGKQQGKEYIENAVLGLLLVIGSYVILYTINPQIVSFNIIIDRPNVTAPETVAVPVLPPAGCTGECVSFSGTGIPLGNVGPNAGASSLIMPKLLQLDSLLKASGIDWRVTEGYPPTTNHTCTCHRTGTCVDAYPIRRTDPGTLNTFVSYARQSGLNPVFEVRTEEERFNLTSPTTRDGRQRENFTPYTGPIIVVPGINGNHFSVYNTSCHQ